MNPWICTALITMAGALGGVINALLTDNGFSLPQKINNVWCPGFVANVLIGACASLCSWALYGSGAAVDLSNITPRTHISLTLSALAGAFFVGVAGARWITNESDKNLLKKSVEIAGHKDIPPEKCREIAEGPARQVLLAVDQV